MNSEMIEAPIRVWKRSPDFPSYEVSNDGRVRRIGAHPEIFLTMSLTTKGRPRHHLRRDGGTFSVETHLLVARAFLPLQPPEKPWVLHADDNPLNCVDTNLRWGDRWDNAFDYMQNRRKRPGYVPSVTISRQRHGPVRPLKLKPGYRTPV